MTVASAAFAADIRVVTYPGDGADRAITIEGPIAPGDFDTFIRLIDANRAAVASVYLFSPGGDFSEAIRIGRALRALELTSLVPARAPSGRPSCDDTPGIRPSDQANCTCASACFFIHVGATRRGGDYLAVHRPFFPSEVFGRLSQKDAMKAFDALQRTAARYLDEMGVPLHVREDVLGTPSDRTLVLDDRTIKTHFRGDLPYLDEWTRNRCSRLTAAERRRLEQIAQRPPGRTSAAETGRAGPESEVLRDLANREGDELACVAAVRRQSRFSAHARYFAARPHR